MSLKPSEGAPEKSNNDFMSLLFNAWELASPPTLHRDAIMRRMSSLYYKAIRFQVCDALCASDQYKNTHSSGSQLSQESLPASSSVLDHLNIKVYTEVILSTEVEGLVYVRILSSVPFTTLDGMSHSMFIPEEPDHSVWINGFLLTILLIFMTGPHSQRS